MTVKNLFSINTIPTKNYLDTAFEYWYFSQYQYWLPPYTQLNVLSFAQYMHITI